MTDLNSKENDIVRRASTDRDQVGSTTILDRFKNGAETRDRASRGAVTRRPGVYAIAPICIALVIPMLWFGALTVPVSGGRERVLDSDLTTSFVSDAPLRSQGVGLPVMPLRTPLPIASLTASPSPTATESATPTATSTATATTTATASPTDPKSYLPLIFRNYWTCSDQYERNDRPADAPLLVLDPLPLVVSANFCGFDPDDYYRMELAESTALKLTLSEIAGDTDLDLYVYSQDLTLVDFSNAGGLGEPEELTHTFASGTYYIRVYPFALPSDMATTGAVRTYKLGISVDES